MNILEFIESPELTPGNFEGDSWGAMKAVLAGAFGLPMQGDRLELFKTLAGGREPPKERVRECFIIAGRRSSKSNTSAAIACYLATVGATLEGLTDKLKPGERGVISLIAVDREQAKVLFNYVMGFFEASPMLSGMIQKKTSESIDLSNKVSIEIHTNSFKAVRGRTLLACLMDECAFYKDENSAAPDVELYRAVVPGLATTQGLLIGISSPYSKKGLLYNKWKRHYGQDSDVLVVQGSTQQFNPTINASVIEEALQEDPEGARSEWLGQWREDISDFISKATLESCTRSKYESLPAMPGVQYMGAVDVAGGGSDEFTAAIAHLEDEKVVIDCVLGEKGNPAEIAAKYATIFKRYRIREITGDRYAADWPVQEFKKHGLRLKPSPLSRSELYLELLPMLLTGEVELPPCDLLLNQFSALERRTSRSGRDVIDHPNTKGSHDDRANVAALAAVMAGRFEREKLPDVKITFAF